MRPLDKSIFLDTSYILAIVFNDDLFNSKANQLSKIITSERINIVTTEFVLVEIADSLSKEKFRNKAIVILKKIRDKSSVVDINKNHYESAWSLYEKRFDKDWGFTDCYSFVVMEKYNIKQALTTDKHFEQAGFEVLLK